MYSKEKQYCSCCGYNTRKENSSSFLDTCRICGWEEDIVQSINPKNYDGINGISLLEAQQNFEKFGACSKIMISKVSKPNEKDIRNSNWKI